MHSWDGWPLARLILLFVAAAYLLIWIQATLMHWRGAFRHRAMWGPVLYTPVAVIVVLAAVVTRADLIETLLVFTLGLATVLGAVGVGYHLRGITAQVGGITMRNLMAGPPPILPLLYAAVGALGLLAWYW